MITEISKPQSIMKESPHTRELFRKNRLQDTLACILTDWTPDDVVKGWPLDSPPLYETQVSSTSFHPLVLVDISAHRLHVRDSSNFLQRCNHLQEGDLFKIQGANFWMPLSTILHLFLDSRIHNPYISSLVRIISFMPGRLGLLPVLLTAVMISRCDINPFIANTNLLLQTGTCS